MDIDKLFSLDSDELDAYLEEEVAKVIASADPEKREQLLAVHNGARMQVLVSKNNTDAMIRTNKLMAESFQKLGKALEVFRK